MTPVLIGGLEALQAGIVYPEFERANAIQGRAIVRFIVTADGETTGAEVVRGVSPGIDSAAVRAVRAARFFPGTQQGVPVRMRMTIPVTFRLDTKPQADSVAACPSPEISPEIIGGIEAIRRDVVQMGLMRRATVSGAVIVRLTVEADGTTSHVEVGRGLQPEFDAAAVAAVRRARFRPALCGGKPIAIRQALPARGVAKTA